MKRLFASLLLLVIIAGCTSVVVKQGDYVLVTYTGQYMNGTVFDTNDPAHAAAFPAPPSHFTSLPVHIGANEVVPGFERALIGMKEGETKTVVIKASDAYGGYDPQKVVVVPKRVVFPLSVHLERTISTPKADFLQKMQVSVVLPGTTFETQNFEYNVTNVTGTDVTLYILRATHDPVSLEGAAWNSTLIQTTPSTLVYKHFVTDNQSYNTAYGPATAHLNATHIVLVSDFVVGQHYGTSSGSGRVTKETDSSITIDFNHQLAGENLNFTVKVNGIQERK